MPPQPSPQQHRQQDSAADDDVHPTSNLARSLPAAAATPDETLKALAQQIQAQAEAVRRLQSAFDALSANIDRYKIAVEALARRYEARQAVPPNPQRETTTGNIVVGLIVAGACMVLAIVIYIRTMARMWTVTIERSYILGEAGSTTRMAIAW
ncbi:hypothetical protein DFJ73DRAFT_773493 [Zopfochytrium polystomum]|nr:hypothetical protein DFJ73DRAFT_773493 [Zopfochytrium polystomum]